MKGAAEAATGAAWPRTASECLGRASRRQIEHEGKAPRPKRVGGGKLEEKGLTGWDGRRIGDRRFGPSGIGRWDG